MLFELFITINLQIVVMSKNILLCHNFESKNKSALHKKSIKYPIFWKYNFMYIKH